MILRPQDRILFIGDSITDCDRGRPIGEHPWPGLGNGYVAEFYSMLLATHPELDFTVLNAGISGNTVRDLAARWQTDVVDCSPTIIVVMIGINDVWRQFDSAHRRNAAVAPDEYRATLDDLARRAVAQSRHAFLATPYYIEPNRQDAMRARMDEYGAIVREVASARGATFVDTQAAFDEFLAHRYPAQIAWDRVHPDRTGHYILARTFAQAFGLTM